MTSIDGNTRSVSDYPEPAAPSAEPSPAEKFHFTGSGSEYFRIWIVNLLLTIVTLGIYSAWAKVRRLRYFYDSTRLAGATFDYHGKPLAILKGRVVALLFLASYNFAANSSVLAGLLMLALLALLGPWLAWKSLQFKLYNSSYRGIRFGFRGTAGKVYLSFLLLPALAFLSAYLLAPFAHQQIKKFQHEETRYGSTRFSFHAGAGSFYKAYLISFLVAIAGVVAIAIGFSGMFATIANAGSIKQAGAEVAQTFFFFILAIYLWMFTLFPMFFTMIQNLIWNNTRLGEHRF
ncbi:MAG: hypothetical protein V7642_1006, partial [Burkholderiales bacterium]